MTLPPLLRRCVEEAIARAPRLIEKAVDHAAQALAEEERKRTSTSERQDIAAATRELHTQRAIWRIRFPQALRLALENPASREPKAEPALRPSSLTLVDDDALMQTIESSRLAQQLGSMVEQPLAELDALMSTALGLDGIRPEENPLRPEVFTQTLRTLMGESQPQPGWPGLWMRPMAEPIAEELNELYRAAARLLAQAQVQAAGYRVVTTAASTSRPAPLEAGASSAPAPLEARKSNALVDFARGASAFAELVAQNLRGARFTDFLFRGGAPQPQQAPAPAYYENVAQELAALEAAPDEPPPDAATLRAYAHLPVVERPAREVSTDRPLNAEVWGAFSAPRQRSLVRTRLKKEAQDVNQVMGLEVVRKLVDQVAQDPRLLAPVREAIVALEPSLLRLAMQSPRFFGEAENPARQLVEKVAERSFKYNDEFSAGFQVFFGPVSASFTALNRFEQLKDPRPFQIALNHLQGLWTEQDREEEEKRKRLLEAVKFAEERQGEADRISWELSQRSDLDGVPAVVQDFLYTRWALVMAHARLQNERREIDPGGFVAIISDLLWSVKREATLREPARAFELIPRVIMKLREGLALLGDKPEENDTFFAALERLHRPVLQLRARHRHQTLQGGPDYPHAEELLPVPPQAPPQPSEDLWLAPDEMHIFGFDEAGVSSGFGALQTGDSGAAPLTATTVPAQELTAGQADAMIAQLHEGSWVDLYSRRKWRRARLTWASTKGTLFMFVSQGGRPHSMTRRVLQKLLIERHVRPIDDRDVVQHAIEVLARPEAQAQAQAA